MAAQTKRWAEGISQGHESGKLEVVKQEMARVNVNILGIGELKWTGIAEFINPGRFVKRSRRKLEKRGRRNLGSSAVASSGCKLEESKSWLRF